MFKLLLTLALIPPTPSVVELPAALEVCIVTAELCIARAGTCEAPTQDERDVCVAAYEDCSYAFPEAHETSCRTALAWCVLQDNSWSKDELVYCENVLAACPTE